MKNIYIDSKIVLDRTDLFDIEQIPITKLRK